MTQGRFIVVEGLEGAGKSSVVEGLVQKIRSNGFSCIQTREPGGTKIGEVIRGLIKSGCGDERLLPESELLLLYAARMQLLHQVIQPALLAGTWVVADRFELSTFAYQGGGRQLDEGMIETLSAFCLKGFKADCMFFLDIMPEQGLMRVSSRGQMDQIETESKTFFSRVYHAYQAHIALMPEVVCIDALQPLPQVMEKINQRLESLYAIS